MASHTSADYIAALGVAYLVQGQPAKAIELLTEAQEQRPADPRLLTDLTAAYLAAADINRRPDDLILALDISERAVRSVESSGLTLPEARFNRALALERLQLTGEADKAWTDYLQHEHSREWSEEARARQKALERRSTPKPALDQLRPTNSDNSLGRREIAEIIRLSPGDARTVIDRELLPAWAAAQLQKKSAESTRLLRRMTLIGGAYTDATSDRMLEESARAIAACDEMKHSDCVSRVATGIQLLQQGQRLSEQFQFRDAAVPLRRAKSVLDTANHPLAAAAALQLAVTSYYARNLELADAQLASLERRLEAKPYYTLLGRLASMRGLIQADRGAFDDATHQYERAATYFERTNDVENQASTANLLADTQRVLGDFSEAWRVRLGALSHLDRLRTQRQEGLLLATARLAEAQELFAASLHFHNAAVDVALTSDGPAAQAQVLVRRAATLQELGDTALSRADADRVAKLLPAVKDTDIRARLEAELLVVQAGVSAVPGDDGASIVRALEFSKNAGLLNYLPRLQHLRGQQLLRAHHADDAAASYDQGIRDFEAGRLQTSANRLRVSYFDRAWDLFADMVALQLDMGHEARAFDYAERGRARTLQDALLSPADSRATLAAVSAGLPPATALLYYVLLEEKSLVWSVTARRTELVQRSVSRATLAQLARIVHRKLRTGGAPADELEALFDALIRPVLSSLDGIDRLVIVADGELNTVPFAALRRRETQRYVIQDYALGLSPSATLWLNGAGSASSAQRAPEVTVIGAPRSNVPGLPDLPGASSEAREIGALYANAHVLVDSATKQDVIDALQTDQIVHFAGHAITNTDYPELSRIVLGGGSGPDGSVIYSQDFSRYKHFGSRLVVLSACSTAAGSLSRGEGPISLARPFLIGGVQSVVASLWDVNDTATRALMVRFHRELKNGRDVFAALRAAQLQMIADPDPQIASPASWAAFGAFGRPYQPFAAPVNQTTFSTGGVK